MFTAIAGFHSKNGLSVVQFGTAEQDSFQYTSSAKAIKNSWIEVKETSQSGSVNNLLVYNHSDQFVFMMDGDILSGAKQNRVVNTSLLLAPKSKTSIPVSCVEQGRWSHISDRFQNPDYAAPASLRSEKARQVRESLRMQEGFTSNQREIWNSVAHFQHVYSVDSQTSNLSDVYDRKANDFDAMIKEFKPHPSANAMSVFLGKQLIGIDLFNRKDIYQEYFPKILRGAALDTFPGKKKAADVSEAEATYRTVEFFDGFENLEFERYEGVGVGEEHRFETEKLTGFSLTYNGAIVHLTALKAAAKQHKG